MTKNWEGEKQRLYDLYMGRNMKLTDVRKIMAGQHGFQASERAYKQKFKEWQWLKKSPRSPRTQLNEHQMSPIDDPSGSDHSSPRVIENGHALYRMHDQRGHHRLPPHMEQPYDQFQHMSVPGFDPEYPAVAPQDMTVSYHNGNGHSHHIGQQHSAGGMTLGPYGRSVGSQPVSLPSVAHLQVNTFRDSCRDAVRHVEMSQYHEARAALDIAIRSLQWLEESSS